MNKFAILEELEGVEEFCKEYLQKQGYTISRPETKVEVKSYLKIPKLSKEAFDKIEEIDNTPLTEKEKQSIAEFKEKVNKFYGTMEDKEWIHEKCNTNTPPTSVPEHPSKGNKKSSFLDINELKVNGLAQCVLRGMIRDSLKELTQKDKIEELNKINSESIYWDIYCEKETTPEMREKIENIYPEFKEQYAKSYLQYDGNEYKIVRDIPQDVKDKFNQKPVTGMELPEYILNKEQLDELMNPGHKKRRNKYSDEIELINKIVDHKIQQFVLNEKNKKN